MGSLSCAVPVLRKERKRIPSIPYSTGFLVGWLVLIVLRQSRAHQAGFLLPVWKPMTWKSVIYLPGQHYRHVKTLIYVVLIIKLRA